MTTVKCLVWDLDNTLWEGILLEGDVVTLKPGVRDVLAALDERGILHSIASHNDPQRALETLDGWNLRPYFLEPQINFDPKPEQVARIAAALDLRPEDLALIDDDPFQREQVEHAFPGLRAYPAEQYHRLIERPELSPENVTAEARKRREFYTGRIRRTQAETDFPGSRLEFLTSCNLRLSLRVAAELDVDRISELIQRTNQLNANGRRYEREAVQQWVSDPGYLVLVADLTDRFGEYGMVGVAVVRKRPQPWLLQTLLVSCRAMGRGVGEGLLVSVLQAAQHNGETTLLADFRKTQHNSAMQLLFATHGFQAVTAADGERLLARELSGSLPALPAWLNVEFSPVKL